MTLAYDNAADGGGAVYRQPPHSFELEQALLGCLMLNNDSALRLPDHLRAEHFYYALHQRLFDAIMAARRRNQLASPLTLKIQFEQDQEFIKAGGLTYLVRLVNEVPSARPVDEFARAIFDLATRRELIRVGEDIVTKAFDSPLDDTPQVQIEAAERELYALAEPAKRGGGFKSMLTAASSALAAAEYALKTHGGISGVPTGFLKLDDLLGGMQRSDLIILAGRPGMGKSALATNIAVHAARSVGHERERGGAVAFFSLEMSAEQLAARVISQFAEIEVWRLRRGAVDPKDFGKLVDATEAAGALPLFFDDSPGLSIAQVAARCRRMARDAKIGLSMIVIDYLQLLDPGSAKRYDSRVQEISEITKGLKNLAKELNVPVLALAQLSRAVDARDDKRPVLSDLRESGSIEQDADVVMFVFREEYYHRSRKPDDNDPALTQWAEKMDRIGGKADVLIEKHRNGATGVVHLAFDGAMTRFDNLAEEDKLPQKRA